MTSKKNTDKKKNSEKERKRKIKFVEFCFPSSLRNCNCLVL